jgi:hypothetical protein
MHYISIQADAICSGVIASISAQRSSALQMKRQHCRRSLRETLAPENGTVSGCIHGVFIPGCSLLRSAGMAPSQHRAKIHRSPSIASSSISALSFSITFLNQRSHLIKLPELRRRLTLNRRRFGGKGARMRVPFLKSFLCEHLLRIGNSVT